MRGPVKAPLSARLAAVLSFGEVGQVGAGEVLGPVRCLRVLVGQRPAVGGSGVEVAGHAGCRAVAAHPCGRLAQFQFRCDVHQGAAAAVATGLEMGPADQFRVVDLEALPDGVFLVVADQS